MNKREVIPIVYAVDDNYVPFLNVSLKSIIDNMSNDCFLKVYILSVGLNEQNFLRLNIFAKKYQDIIDVEFVDVADRLDKIATKIHLRDYYTKAIYYRIFIPSLFPQYKKIIYIDCDIVFTADIKKLYHVDIGDNIVAAVHEEAMSFFDCFGLYSEAFLEVPRMQYFNSGLLVINTALYNKENIETKFINLMLSEKFEVAPDQDYLNVILKNRVFLLDIGWNKTPIPQKEFPESNINIVHYKLNFKPWHYEGIKYENYFWKYAKETPYYNDLLNMRDTYSLDLKLQDEQAFNRLKKMAMNYVHKKKGDRQIG